MSSKRKKNRNVIHFDSDHFFDMAERQMQDILNDGGNYMKLAESFKQGFPLDNLFLLLDSDKASNIENGIFILRELGEKAKYFKERLIQIMTLNNYGFKYYGMEVLQECAEEEDEFADWILISLLEIPIDESDKKMFDFQVLLCSKAIHCLSILTFGQLRGARRYLMKNNSKSSHIHTIDYYLKFYDNKNKILELIKSENILFKKYGIAMMARFFPDDSLLLKEALSIEDIAIRKYLSFWCCPVQGCPCPTDVRRPENGGGNAKTGEKVSGEIDENRTEKGESPK